MILNSRSDGQLPDTTSVYKDMLRIHGKLLKYRYVDGTPIPAKIQISHFLKVGQFYIDVYNICKIKGRKILGFH